MEGLQPLNETQQKINMMQGGMLTGYCTLASFSPYNKPVMVHHILHICNPKEKKNRPEL